MQQTYTIVEGVPMLNLDGAKLEEHIRQIEKENARMIEHVPEQNQAHFDPNDIPYTRLLTSQIRRANPVGYTEVPEPVHTRLPYVDAASIDYQANLGQMHEVCARGSENPHFAARNADVLWQAHRFDPNLVVPSFLYDFRPELRHFPPVIAGCLAELRNDGRIRASCKRTADTSDGGLGVVHRQKCT